MTASKRHSIEDIRTNPAVPGIAPWSEFIRFAESLGEDIGPGFGRDAARVGRYVKELEEQFDAYRNALAEAHDQLCGCDRPTNPSVCITPEETWGAFALLVASTPASRETP